jgi:hypothetical protein
MLGEGAVASSEKARSVERVNVGLQGPHYPSIATDVRHGGNTIFCFNASKAGLPIYPDSSPRDQNSDRIFIVSYQWNREAVVLRDCCSAQCFI